MEEERLPFFFEPAYPGRPGVNRLELAACRSIVRRLQGKIEAVSPGNAVRRWWWS